jgi:hypothetical protein
MMRAMRTCRGFASCVVAAAAVIAACASAGKTADVDATRSSGSDAAPVTSGEAGIDALVAVTLSQNTGTTIGSASSVTCGNTDGTTAENSWYRVFKPSDDGIVAGFHVTAVTFGVQEATGMPAVQVRIGTYGGAITPPPTQLDTGLITPLASMAFNVPTTFATAATTMTVPISANVPPLSQLIVEIFAPNQSGTSKYFYLGGNSTGETRPSYLRAPGGTCATPQPATTASLGFPTSNLVITVSGTR